jgi:hypothetical protein
MPRTKRAPGKVPRAPTAAATLRKVKDIAFDMEQPLHDAADYVRALMLVGFGMMGPGPNEDERAIVALADSAADRLDAVEQSWNAIRNATRGRRRQRARR